MPFSGEAGLVHWLRTQRPGVIVDLGAAKAGTIKAFLTSHFMSTQPGASPTKIISGLHDICTGFPRIPDPIIERPHFLTNFDEMLEGSSEIVTIEGEEGCGKTTLAAQFAIKHPDRAFSLFVSAASSYARSPEYLLNVLCDQVRWYFKGVRLPSNENPERYLRSAYLQLQHHATASGKPFFFVIDGLLQTSAQDAEIVSLMLTEYLPVGIPVFKFLLTGDKNRLPEGIKGKIAVSTWRPPGFSPDETKKYLAGLGISDEATREINNTFRGMPGKLASIRRIILAGTSPSAFESDLPRTLSDLLQSEWRAVCADDETQQGSLALLAYSQHPLRIGDMAQILQKTTNEISNRLMNLQFITPIDAPGDYPEAIQPAFVSNAMKAYAATILNSRKQWSLERIVATLYSRPSSPEAIEHLPQYLDTLGKPRDLINYLTLDHLTGACKSSNSLQPIKGLLKSGMRASQQEGDPVNAFQFAFELALLSDVGAASVLVSEVNAYMTLGQDASALKLIQGALLKEDRFEGLAKVVTTISQRGEVPDPGMLAEIRRLADSVDYSSSPERATSIASDLIGILPELAMELIDRAMKGSVDSSDIAFATLALSLRDRERQQKENGTSDEAISSRIQNPSVKSLTHTLSAVVGEYSVDEILRRAEQIESVRTCLHLLAEWSTRNRDHSDAYKVMHYGLQRALRTSSDYTLDCRTARRLVVPLPTTAGTSPHEANKILQTIDAQEAVLLATGSSVENVRLRITLLETEALWSADRGVSRAEQLCYFAATLDPDLRAESLAWIIAATALDRHGRLGDVRAAFGETLRSDLEATVNELLSGTAEHFEVFRRTVRALALADFSLMDALLAKVNTRDRRDLLRAEALSWLSATDLCRLGAPAVQDALGKIGSKVVQDSAITNLAVHLNSDSPPCDLAPSWLPVLKRSLTVLRAPWKSLACAHSEAVCKRQHATGFVEAGDLFAREADVALTAINSDWDKTDIGFTLAALLHPVDAKQARELTERAHTLRSKSVVPDGRSAEFHIAAIRLAIRAFAGLLHSQSGLEEPLQRLRAVINCVPSDGERAQLWCELAIRCFGRGQKDFGTRVIDEEVPRLLKNIADPGFKAFILASVAPALYSAHPISAVNELTALDEYHRNEAFSNIAANILSGLPLSEPLPRHFVRSNLALSDIDDLLECLRHISKDTGIAWVVERICEHLASKDGREKFSRAERTDISRRIGEATDGKLPWPDGITHKGYSLVLAACRLQIQDATENQWRDLAKAIDAIPNLADQVLIMAIIADHSPSKLNEMRADLLSKAQNLVKSIPSPIDQIGRLEAIASCAESFDRDRAKSCLQDATELVSRAKDFRDDEGRRRSLIDIAHRIDSDFAVSLADKLDQDPAIQKRRKVSGRTKLKKVLRELGNGDPEEKLAGLTAEETVELCEMMLPGLHDNSVANVRVPRIAEFISRFASLPFRDTSGALAWVIENSVHVHMNTPYGKTHLVQLFGACASACELSIRLMSWAAGYQYGDSEAIELSLDADGTEVIEPGERTKAIDLIARWIGDLRPESVRICDPYFSPNDLDIIKLISQVSPGTTIQILAGEKKQLELGMHIACDVEYQQHWRTLSQQNAPTTDIVIAGLANNHECPIHERWILAGGKGLRLGTSFSGLGKVRVSEISYLSDTVALAHQNLLDQYLGSRVRENDGVRIRYFAFSL
jgi:hypothetical protein